MEPQTQPKERIHIEDALKHLHDCRYRGMPATAQSLAGALAMDLAAAGTLMGKLESAGLAERSEGQIDLTPDGQSYARHVLRAHRLYETYLARETGLSELEWHVEAEAKEHEMSPAELEALARRLGDPRFDPHGDPIPTPAGEIPPPQGTPLLDRPRGWEGRISHVEDEPPETYADIVEQGLAPGVEVRVEETGADGVSIRAQGRTLRMSRPTADNIMVSDLAADERFDDSVDRLSSLEEGEQAAVVGLSPACMGPERNRLLDLGLVPGTEIYIEFSSPSGNPIAYHIRGATIALRREQAERILIRKA